MTPAGPRKLAGRIAVVAGASGDIGAALALALAAQGASLILLGRDPARLGRVVAKASQAGAPAVDGFALDLSDQQQTLSWAQTLATSRQRIHILVHAAGAYGRGDVADAPVDQLDQQYRLNLRAPYLLTQALLPALRGGGSDIVFLNSSQAATPGRGLGSYASTQRARSALAESLRAEVNELGIRVLSVFLGRTAGRRQEEVFSAEGRPYAPDKLMQPEDVAAMVVAALCLSHRAEVMSMSLRPALKSY